MRYYLLLFTLLTLSTAAQTPPTVSMATKDSTYYYANGQIERIDGYNEKGQHVSSRYFKEDGAPSEIVQASFVGGKQELYRYIGQNIRYPKSAAMKNKVGKVYIRFWVDEAGKVVQPQVLDSPHKSFSEEALRIVNAMPNWAPGTRDGQPHKFLFTLPITFQKM